MRERYRDTGVVYRDCMRGRKRRRKKYRERGQSERDMTETEAEGKGRDKKEIKRGGGRDEEKRYGEVIKIIGKGRK